MTVLCAITLPRAKALELAQGGAPAFVQRVPPPRWLFDQRLAIHASAARPRRAELVGVVRVVAAVMFAWDTGEYLRSLGPISDLQAEKLSRSREWGAGAGGWLWLVSSPMAIEPVDLPARAGRLWPVPEVVAAEILNRITPTKRSPVP